MATINSPAQFNIQTYTPFRVKTDSRNFVSALAQSEGANKQKWMLFQIYKNIELDSYLTGLLRQRKDAVLQSDYILTDSSDTVITDKIKYNWFDQILEIAFKSIFWGQSMVNIKQVVNGKVTAIEEIPVELTDIYRGLILDTPSSTSGLNIYSEELHDYIVPFFKTITELGEYKNISMDVIGKMANKAAFTEYTERYGTPYRIVKTDVVDPETRDQISLMLSQLGKNAWAVLPSDAEFDMIQPDSDGALYEKNLRYLDEQLSIAILGQTLTSAAGKNGSRALGEVHERVARNIIEADLKYIETNINDQLLPRLANLRVIPANSKFQFANKQLNLMDKLDMVTKLHNAGFEIDSEWIQNTFQIPMKDAVA